MHKSTDKAFYDKDHRNSRLLFWVGKTMQIALSVILFILIIIAVVIIANSQGKMKPLTDGDGNKLEGSIVEKTYVNIGGVEQDMFIWGEDINNPVLLFIHGGPCFSEYFLFDNCPTGLEKVFTICHWEQRGGGLSSDPDLSPESITLEQLTSDIIEITNYLRKRFDQDKIYLAAHSGGTIIAIQAAAKAPQLYHAYLGIAQITNQPESEKIAYQYMVEKYEQKGNKKMVDKLKEYPLMTDDSYVNLFYKSMLRDQTMHDLGIGTMRNMKSLETGVVLPIMLCRAFTVKEKINLWRSKIFFIRKTGLADQVLAANLPSAISEMAIPVYFFSGVYDFTVNHDLSKAYLEKLKAPKKAFYSFSNSAHSPLFEEPDKMIGIITTDILGGMH